MTPREKGSSEFVPENWDLAQPDFLQRWEDGEFVRLTVAAMHLYGGILVDDPKEQHEDRHGLFEGSIGGARCLPMGHRLFHSDMGCPTEVWKILDPMPNIGARPGDLLFHCPWAIKGRDGKGLDAWPTKLAIMYEDETTYVAFITMEQWRELHFPAAEQDLRQAVVNAASGEEVAQ